MTTALELLVAGRELISDVGRWTQDALARLPDGRKVDPLDPDACRWCALGALYPVAKAGSLVYGRSHEVAVNLLNEAAGELDADPEVLKAVDPALRPRHIAFVNDAPDGHGFVLRAYDIAIERARAKEAGG